MSKAAPPHRWFQAWRAAEPPVQGDPADMGTAFGLDLSLLEAAAEAGAPAQRGAAVAAPRRGWMHRLAARRKPAA
jgi:hypothetical protein